MTPEIQRLFTEFAAQDVGAFAISLVMGKHVKVAVWNDGNNMWVITPEGKDLLNPADEVESVDTLASAPKRAAKKAKGIQPDPELELGDL